MNDFETKYVREIREALEKRTDLTERERHLLEYEIVHIEQGTVSLTGPHSVEDRLARLRNHYP